MYGVSSVYLVNHRALVTLTAGKVVPHHSFIFNLMFQCWYKMVHFPLQYSWKEESSVDSCAQPGQKVE